METNDPVSVLSDKQLAYLDWLVTPPPDRRPPYTKEMAAQLEVHPKTLQAWKRREDFRKAWEERVRQVTGTPERAQGILDKLFETAMDPTHRDHVRAADLYFKLTGRVKPPEPPKVEGGLEKLSDSELEALINQGVQREMKRRELSRGHGGGRGTLQEQVARLQALRDEGVGE